MLLSGKRHVLHRSTAQRTQSERARDTCQRAERTRRVPLSSRGVVQHESLPPDKQRVWSVCELISVQSYLIKELL